MNGFRLFPIHILIKDLSFMFLYWLLVKYAFTDIKNPSITSETTLGEMISGLIYYNIVTLIVSFILYFPIVYGIRKIQLQNDVELILTGLVLTLTTPILYLYFKDWNHNDYYVLKPELIAWGVCFIISISFYYLVNKRSEKLRE